MAEYKPLISPEELRTNLIDKSFKDKPHPFYVVYDNLMDELIFKIVEPDHLAAAYFITEEFALLVDPDNFEVVGYQLVDFTEVHLPKFDCTSQMWFKENLEEHFKNFVELTWTPKNKRTHKNHIAQDAHLYYAPKILDEALATC